MLTGVQMCFVDSFFLFSQEISNLVPSTKTSFDRKRHLCQGDVFIEDDNLVIWIKWSKTLQSHERVVLIPLAPIPKHPLCPVQAYQDMVAAIPATDNAPLFVMPGTGGVTPLTSSVFTKWFKQKISECGLDPRRFSIHSLRRGGASFAFHCGVEPLLIKTHGDWKSNAFLEYLSFSLVTRQMSAFVRENEF